MVLISEISKEGFTQLRHGDGAEDEGGGIDNDGTSQIAAAEAESLIKESDSILGKSLCNERASRAAYIMGSYLQSRPSSGSGSGDVASYGEVSGGGEGCRALMEVVKKETGRWLVSKVILEHAHSLATPPDHTGTATNTRLVPTVGMEFDSISLAKAFYYTYSEKMGFKARTGSGKRSKGNRIMVMQRFMCSKGSYPPFGSSTCESTIRRKRGPYKKRTSDTGVEGNRNRAAEVLLAESNADREGIPGCEIGFEDQVSHPEKIASLEAQDSKSKPSASEFDLENSVAAVGMNGEKEQPLVGIPAQSRLLRELGIRVSRYTHEERRDILLRYMRKRNNRQVVDRSSKVPSRQALAERRQRGFGGKFLSKEETRLQTVNQPQEIVDEDPEISPEVVATAGGVPLVGMGFESEDKAYEYYVSYAANIGFSARKGLWNKSSKNVTKSRIFACSREGFRSKNAATEVKRSRPETRTGCPAKMVIKAASFGRYRVVEFVADHNHQLALPLDIQILKSQKLLSTAKHTNQQNTEFIPAGYNNYTRAKRARDMKVGDAGAILEYLQKMKGCNPSFYYAIQVDEHDKMANVFWADARSILDYYYFGDAVCFYMPYKTDGCDRPLALFIGVNHHKQAVIFGSAFLYCDTAESLKWLFETFQTAMADKQPRTIFTEQCKYIDDAIAAVWPDTCQRLCTWQMYRHAFKHLGELFQASECFEHDFCQCIFDFEDEEVFLAAWLAMLEKYNLKANEWLLKLYEKKEKWAPAYNREVFCADLQTTLRNECLNNILKEWLNQEENLSYFFRQYERLLEEKHYAELQADYHADEGIPRIPPIRMLWQASSVYTPAMFEVFKSEYDLLMNCVVYNCGEIGGFSEYEVTLKGKTRAHFVRFDSLDGSIICSCKKFFFVGIQCCHALKVLDFRNVKELPQQYILKRWRKDAKSGSSRNNQGHALDGDSKPFITKRYNSLCRVLYRIAERAADNTDAFTLVVGQSDQLIEQVEQILQTKLLEKPSSNNALKGIMQNSAEIQASLDGNGESLKISCKKRREAAIQRRQQVGLELNKKHKLNKGQAEQCNVAARDLETPLSTADVIPQIRSSNQFIAASHYMQGPYVSGHQFGLAAAQGFHTMTQLVQDASVLQQPFHGSSHLNQPTVPGYSTPEMHAFQFVGSNPQLDHPGSDQGHCNVPLWDFL